MVYQDTGGICPGFSADRVLLEKGMDRIGIDCDTSAIELCGDFHQIHQQLFLPFFLLGAYMAMYHPGIVTGRAGHKACIWGLAGCATVCVLATLCVLLQVDGNLQYTLRVLGCVCVWFALDCLPFEKKPGGWLQASFPIYVMHGAFIKIGKVLAYRYLPHSKSVLLAEYILLPTITVALIIGINYLMNKNRCTRKVWRFMLGNR